MGQESSVAYCRNLPAQKISLQLTTKTVNFRNMDVFTGYFLIALVCSTLGFLLHKRRQYEQQFAQIPGPKGLPLLQNALQLDLPRLPWILTEWGKVYGPVYKVGLMGRYAVVINGYDAIHEFLAKGGKDTAGRPDNFRLTYLFKDTGFFQLFPNDVWKLTRKLFHQYTKQFDVGLHALEEAIASQSVEMFDKFDKAARDGSEMDPSDIISDVALKIILVLICGDQLSDDDPTFLASKEYEALVWEVSVDTSFDATLLDTFPWLRHVPLRISKLLKRVSELQMRVTTDLKRRALAHDPEKSLLGCLYQHAKGDDGVVYLTDDDVLFATASTLFAGRGTSSVSFTFLVNILAHHPEIQDKIAKEIHRVSPNPEEYVGLKFRDDLPYTRATLLEDMRYHSVAALFGLKATTSTRTVCGISVPANTKFFPNAWGMHHDREFWGDPESFRPDRFLDDAGDLVPADDPKRRHLMPFGEGLRSCPGEQFAKSRLFLWLANTCKKFRISPGRENSPESVSPDALTYKFIMYPPRAKVCFEKRIF